jgi:hypothetical protein
MTDLERRRPLERRSRQVKAPRPDATVSPPATGAFGTFVLDADSLTNTVVDIACTLPGCRRAVTASLLEVHFSRPCPLCRTCPGCRADCAEGLVEHGIAPGTVWPAGGVS